MPTCIRGRKVKKLILIYPGGCFSFKKTCFVYDHLVCAVNSKRGGANPCQPTTTGTKRSQPDILAMAPSRRGHIRKFPPAPW